MSAKFHKSNSEVEYIPRQRISWYYTKRIPLSFHSFETNCSVFLSKNPTIPPLITSFVLQITIGAFLKRLANLSFSFFFLHDSAVPPTPSLQSKMKRRIFYRSKPQFSVNTSFFWGDVLNHFLRRHHPLIQKGRRYFFWIFTPPVPSVGDFPKDLVERKVFLAPL